MLARILGNNVADRLCRIIELERGSIFPELLQRVDQFIYCVTERGVASEIISLLFHYKPPVENSANGKRRRQWIYQMSNTESRIDFLHQSRKIARGK